MADRLHAGSEACLPATSSSRWLTATVRNESAWGVTAPGGRTRAQPPLRAARGKGLVRPRPHRCVTRGPCHAGSPRWCGPSRRDPGGTQRSPSRHVPEAARAVAHQESGAAEAPCRAPSRSVARRGATCLGMPAAVGGCTTWFGQRPSLTTNVPGQLPSVLCRGRPLKVQAGGFHGRSPLACRRPWPRTWKLQR